MLAGAIHREYFLLQCLKKEIATAKELDFRPLGKVIIFRDKQRDKQTSLTGGSNRPFRCLDEGGGALPKFLVPFQTVSKKHSRYDLLSGGLGEITIWM